MLHTMLIDIFSGRDLASLITEQAIDFAVCQNLTVTRFYRIIQ